MNGGSRASLAELRERFTAVAASVPDLGALSGQLYAVVHVLDTQHALRRGLSDPSTDADRKADVARGLFAAQLDATATDLVSDAARLRWPSSTDFVDGLEHLAVLVEAAAAERDGTLDDVEDELFRFGRIVQNRAELRTALTDRAAGPDAKQRLLADLLADKVAPSTLRLVTEVVTHPRGRSLERGLEFCGQVVAQRRQRLVALVRSARPLTDGQRDRLVAALAAAYGHEVHVNIEVDPEILGGLSVQVGDEVIDGTVAGRLEEVRRRLV